MLYGIIRRPRDCNSGVYSGYEVALILLCFPCPHFPLHCFPNPIRRLSDATKTFVCGNTFQKGHFYCKAHHILFVTQLSYFLVGNFYF